ncbi:glutamate--tRNA ligase family protein, partial [Treponema sp. R8-4-B8]
MTDSTGTETEPQNSDDCRTDFISEFIKEDLAAGKYTYVLTRFPPEPTGWLYIGHCKAFFI